MTAPSRSLLEVVDLHARVALDAGTATQDILRGLTLSVPAGSVHAIMGPNGSGKSTLSYVLSGRPGYEATDGEARLEGADLLSMAPEERATAGLFLSFQYPVEIPGLPTLTFVREAVNAQRTARGQEELDAPSFLKRARTVAGALQLDLDMLKRPVNVGFSGGEKKRLEIFQALMLEPRFLILDETDSGLDIDALKTVADGVNQMRGPDRGMLVITHYKRLLDYILPDVVHVMAAGRIVASGGPEVADRLEAEGYGAFIGAPA